MKLLYILKKYKYKYKYPDCENFISNLPFFPKGKTRKKDKYPDMVLINLFN